MQTAGRDLIFYSHSGENEPAITVESGEVFQVDTALCSGDWLQGPDDLWSSEKSKGPNPTVCIAVRDAVPGDLLAVEILQVEPERLGYTSINDHRLFAACMGHDIESRPKTVTIADGLVHWSNRLHLPVKPMIGTLGTAAPDNLPNSYGGYYGGNMDVQEVSAGTTVYLPVLYPGALLQVGDVHAIQGDGEICCAGGIECSARVTLRASLVRRPFRQQCVTAEDSGYLMTIACLKTTDESFQMACGELIRFACSRYDISVEECYMLASQVMEARCTQYVNPTRSYVCKLPKKVLDAGYELR